MSRKITIKERLNLYLWAFKNMTRKPFDIVSRCLTLPLCLCYGLFWALALIVKMFTIILSLSYHRAGIPQWQLEIGRVFLIHGANLQVGQPVRFKKTVTGKVFTKYVQNLHYDFRNNKINTTYQDKPLKGISDRFIK
jgi:hypothetical protein